MAKNRFYRGKKGRITYIPITRQCINCGELLIVFNNVKFDSKKTEVVKGKWYLNTVSGKLTKQPNSKMALKVHECSKELMPPSKSNSFPRIVPVPEYLNKK